VWRQTSSSMTDRAKSSLDVEKNPNRARMNLMLDGNVVKQDGVIVVKDVAAIVVAVTTVGGAE